MALVDLQILLMSIVAWRVEQFCNFVSCIRVLTDFLNKPQARKKSQQPPSIHIRLRTLVKGEQHTNHLSVVINLTTEVDDRNRISVFLRKPFKHAHFNRSHLANYIDAL